MGTSIAVIVGLGTLKTWPELITACVQGLEGSDINALEGSLDALFKVRTCMQFLQPGPDLMPLLLDSRLRTTSYLEVSTTACEPVYHHTVTLGLFVSSDADAPGLMPMMESSSHSAQAKLCK